MPLYDFKCPDCGRIEEKAFKVEELPNEIPCTLGCNGIMKRFFQKIAIKIPEGWGESSFDFSKRPSKRKRYF